VNENHEELEKTYRESQLDINPILSNLMNMNEIQEKIKKQISSEDLAYSEELSSENSRLKNSEVIDHFTLPEKS
jgi:L-lysine 2,3-aminomutase